MLIELNIVAGEDIANIEKDDSTASHESGNETPARHTTLAQSSPDEHTTPTQPAVDPVTPPDPETTPPVHESQTKSVDIDETKEPTAATAASPVVILDPQADTSEGQAEQTVQGHEDTAGSEEEQSTQDNNGSDMLGSEEKEALRRQQLQAKRDRRRSSVCRVM